MDKLKTLTEHNGVRLTEVTTSIKINASAKRTWEVLSHYGDVSTFHAGVVKSVNHKDHPNKAALGAERTCDILDGKREVVLRERITEYVEGSHYRYQVFDWENFPLKAMFFAFNVNESSDNKSTLSLTINYRLKPGVITNLMKWKIKRMEKDILTGYKHYTETGEANVAIPLLENLNYQFA